MPGLEFRVWRAGAPFTVGIGANPLISRLRQHVVPPQPPQLLSREARKQGRSRQAGKQGSREAGKPGSREAGKQGSREAGKQGSREAGQGRGQGDSGDRRVALPSLRNARPGASVRASSAHANGQRAPAATSLGFKF